MLFGFLVFMGSVQERRYVTVHKTMTLMGTRLDITLVTANEELGYINIDEAVSEIQRIEDMISSSDPDSETSLINKNAGIMPVKVSYELFKLIERSKQISEITDGAFDITYAALDEVWKFDGSMQYKPTTAEIKKALAKVGHRKIVLNAAEHTVFLKERGMRISFAGIGKGYAVERAKELLVSKQVTAGMINAGGDLTSWGTKVSGEKWLLGVANPGNREKIFTWLPILESSVGTSESFGQYVTIEGKKHSHILDPRTGYPVSGIHSVSIFAKSAELCDALATAVFVLGKEAGLALINQLGDTEVILIDSDNKMHKSTGILLGN